MSDSGVSGPSQIRWTGHGTSSSAQRLGHEKYREDTVGGSSSPGMYGEETSTSPHGCRPLLLRPPFWTRREKRGWSQRGETRQISDLNSYLQCTFFPDVRSTRESDKGPFLQTDKSPGGRSTELGTHEGEGVGVWVSGWSTTEMNVLQRNKFDVVEKGPDTRVVARLPSWTVLVY